MTQAQAQAFLERTIVRYNGQDGETEAFAADGSRTDEVWVMAPDQGSVHGIDSEDVIEDLTVQQIIDLAAGG